MKLIHRRCKRKNSKNKIFQQPFTEEELKIQQAIKRDIAERELAAEESNCFFCGKRYSNCVDKFYCVYCHHFYCSDHRLPGNHNCKGNPKRPPFNGVVTYRKGAFRYRGKL